MSSEGSSRFRRFKRKFSRSPRSITPEPPGSGESSRSSSLSRITFAFRRSTISRTTLGEGLEEPASATLIPPTPSESLTVPDPNTGPVSVVISPSPQVPDPADDIFREALENHKLGLSLGQQQVFLSESVVGLLDIVKALDQQHTEESRTRRSIVKAQGFLQVADGYLKVLGIFIQHSPQYSALVVGGLKLFVDIGRRFAGFFDKLSDTMERLGGHLNYLAKYAKLYGHYMEVKEALCEAYGDLILFCKTASEIIMNDEGKLNSRISARVLFGQLSSPLEARFDAIKIRFNEHITKVEKTTIILENERKLLKEVSKAHKQADCARSKLLCWLSNLQPEDDLERTYQKRHANTGTWFIESEQLQELLQSDNHCLLWCFGQPGVGKSVLSSILVEELTSRHPFDERVGIAFFYFSFQSETITQTPASFLSILIKQLCRRKTVLTEPLKALYGECTKNDRKPKLAELQDQFQAIVGTFDEVFLVIDALDECEKEVRQQLLPYISGLFNHCPGKLKTFVTSRPESDIKRAFGSANCSLIQVEAAKVEEDIAAYVQYELEHRIHDYCDIDPALREEITDVLVSQSDGMFLWVRCQLDSIYLHMSMPDIRACLKSLPVDMTGTYRRILDRIYAQPPAVVDIAKRALTWVVTAVRPLTPMELAIAIAIELPPHTDTRSNEENGVFTKYKSHVAIGACCGLLSIDGGVVRPFHFTVQEFIKRDERGIGSDIKANALLAESMLHFMICEIRGSNYATYFKRSIFQFWDFHVRKVPLPLPQELEIILKSVSSSKNLRTSAKFARAMDIFPISELEFFALFDLELVYRDFHPLQSFADDQSEVQSAVILAAEGGAVSALAALLDVMHKDFLRETLQQALPLASGNGHVEILQLLIDRGANINSSTAFQEAASRRQTRVLQYLLATGADINAQGGEYGNALQAVSYYGHGEIVKFLLAAGADVNAQGGQFGNALQAAASLGHTDVVECLLTAGANVNAQGGECGNALQAAAHDHCRRTVECLLAAGADVNAQGGEYGNALQAAAHLGDREIVESIVATGVDVNTAGGRYGTALQAAAACYKGRETVQCLLAAGALVNATGGEYGNALQAAARHGTRETIECLLAAGADLNAEGGKYGNALQAAALSTSTQNVECLLAVGADVNAQGGEYGNALQAAASRGTVETVQYLVSAGAHVNAPGGKYENALQAAASRSNKNLETVELLLAAGANLNAHGGEYGNALQAAASHGVIETVQYLLAAGADVSAQGGRYGNALQAAASNDKNLETVEFLLAAGADVNAQGGQCGNALQAAIVYGAREIVQCLLAAGAHVNATGGEYGNALQAAAVGWKRKTIQCLLAAGAEVNATGGMFGTALQAAARTGLRKNVECLLAAGADVNTTGGKYGNALQAAAKGDDRKIVEWLLAAGADVNAKGGKYGNALQAAARHGQSQIVHCLLASGANVNATGGKYGNAFLAAAVGCKLESAGARQTVECLLAACANENAQRGP